MFAPAYVGRKRLFSIAFCLLNRNGRGFAPSYSTLVRWCEQGHSYRVVGTSSLARCMQLFDAILVLDRPQQLHELGRSDVLVIRRQQSVVFSGIVFAAGPGRLCAIECPIAPG